MIEVNNILQVYHSKDTSVSLWVTDIAPCANINLVAISSTEREISEIHVKLMFRTF